MHATACLALPFSPLFRSAHTKRAPLRGLAPLLLAQPSTPAHSQRPCLLAPSLSSHTWWYGTPRWVRTREEHRQGPQSSGPEGSTMQPCSHLASSPHLRHTHAPSCTHPNCPVPLTPFLFSDTGRYGTPQWKRTHGGQGREDRTKWVGEGTQQPFSCLASYSFHPFHLHTTMA